MNDGNDGWWKRKVMADEDGTILWWTITVMNDERLK